MEMYSSAYQSKAFDMGKTKIEVRILAKDLEKNYGIIWRFWGQNDLGVMVVSNRLAAKSE